MIVRAFFMRRIKEYIVLFLMGGCIYYSFEIVFRGFSHWSMFLLGGLSLWFCTWQGLILEWKEPLWKQVLYCVIFVTSMEFMTGLLVNRVLGWNVWDYSEQPFQLFGQICVPFMIIFAGLCVMGILLGASVAHKFFHEPKPDWHIL